MNYRIIFSRIYIVWALIYGCGCASDRGLMMGSSGNDDSIVLYILPGPHLDSQDSMIVPLPVTFFSNEIFYGRSPTYKGGVIFDRSAVIQKDHDFLKKNSTLVGADATRGNVASYLYIMTPNSLEFRYISSHGVERFLKEYSGLVGRDVENTLRMSSKFAQERWDGNDLVRSSINDNYAEELGGYYTVNYPYRSSLRDNVDPFANKQ